MLKHKDLESWEIFCAVAEAGSISGACDLCDCDAAYISRLIKNLENSIGGVELLDRTTRPLTLTEPGKIALQYARQLSAIHKNMLSELRQDPDALSGVLRVAIPPMVLDTFALPFILDFQKDFPDIDLQISESSSSLPINFDGPHGKLDVVCGYGPDAVHPNIYQLHYGHAPMIPCASPLYIKKYGFPNHPEELKNHIGVVLRSNMRPVIRYVLKGDEKIFLQWKKSCFYDSAHSAMKAALFGAGIHAGIPALNCYQELRQHQLVPVLPGRQPKQTELYVYARPEAMKLRKTKTFIRRYVEFMQAVHTECEKSLEPIIGKISITL